MNRSAVVVAVVVMLSVLVGLPLAGNAKKKSEEQKAAAAAETLKNIADKAAASARERARPRQLSPEETERAVTQLGKAAGGHVLIYSEFEEKPKKMTSPFSPGKDIIAAGMEAVRFSDKIQENRAAYDAFRSRYSGVWAATEDQRIEIVNDCISTLGIAGLNILFYDGNGLPVYVWPSELTF